MGGLNPQKICKRENMGTLLTKDTNPHTCDYEMRKKNRVGMGRWSK